MSHVKFTFQGPEYSRIVVFYDYLADYLKFQKTEKLNNFRRLGMKVISSGQ